MANTAKDKWKKGQAASKGAATRNNQKPAVKPAANKPKSDRHFVGGGWDNTGEYGTFVNVQLNLEKLNEIEPDQYGNIRLTIASRKTPDEKSGQDVMVYAKEGNA